MKNKNSFWCVTISIMAMWLLGCEKDMDVISADSPRPVKSFVIGEFEHRNIREFPGVVDVKQKADLSFRIPGKINQILVKEGDKVSKDQLLASMDVTNYQITLEKMDAEFQKATSDFSRAQELLAKNYISRSEYDSLKTNMSKAESNREAAIQDINNTKLKAPFAGIIAKRYVDAFEEINAKEPMFLLNNLSTLIVEFEVPEHLVIKPRTGKKVYLTAVFDSLPGQEFPLTFQEISTQADSLTKAYRITASMSNARGHNIFPGMAVTVRGVPINESNEQGVNKVFVPLSVVMKDDEGTYVFTLNPVDGNWRVTKNYIVIGNIDGNSFEVINGLKNGDRVLSAGMSKVRTDMIVRLMQ